MRRGSSTSRQCWPSIALLYASGTAWCWRFATASDKQRHEAFVRRDVGLRWYGTIPLWCCMLAAEVDDALFRNRGRRSVSHPSFTTRSCHTALLNTATAKTRRHDRSLTAESDDGSFVTRESFVDIMLLCIFTISLLCVSSCVLPSVHYLSTQPRNSNLLLVGLLFT